MGGSDGTRILARCVVCRGDIFEGDVHEEWEGGYYCRRHSLTYLRARAQEYREMLAQEAASHSTE